MIFRKKILFHLVNQVKVAKIEEITDELVTTNLTRALSHHCTLQACDGHWPGDYGGLIFPLPCLDKDGGWQLHIQKTRDVNGSTLAYVALRLLGEDIEGGDGAIQKGRNWILDNGGATYAGPFTRLWLSPQTWGRSRKPQRRTTVRGILVFADGRHQQHPYILAFGDVIDVVHLQMQVYPSLSFSFVVSLASPESVVA